MEPGVYNSALCKYVMSLVSTAATSVKPSIAFHCHNTSVLQPSVYNSTVDFLSNLAYCIGYDACMAFTCYTIRKIKGNLL